jgi:hypothetical protein
MAETYDVLITVPDTKTYEFRASAEDGTGYAVAHIGSGALVPAPSYPKPNLVLMDMMHGTDHMDHRDHANPMNHINHMDHRGMGGGHERTSMGDIPMTENRAGGMTRVEAVDHTGHSQVVPSATSRVQSVQTNKHKVAENHRGTITPHMEGPVFSDTDHHKLIKGIQGQTCSSLKQTISHSPTSYPKHRGHAIIEHPKSSGHYDGDLARNDKRSSQQDEQVPHVDDLNTYKMLKSPVVTTLPKEHPTRLVPLRLTGSMERYVWSINERPMYATDKILIRRGENVKFILMNETIMNHPIHLHGHFFRVLNGQGAYSPLKHTVNVPAFDTVEIEFAAHEEKEWIFHCHNLYHMALGMGGIIHYGGTTPDAEVMTHSGDHFSSEHGNRWFQATTIGTYSNFGNAATRFMRHNDYLTADFRYNYQEDYEGELTYQRYVSVFLGVYMGGRFKREQNESTNRGMIGCDYTLPLLMKMDLRIDTKGKVRFGLSNDHQLTDHLSFDWHWNTDNEYTFGIYYAMTKQLYIAGNYDSRERWGIGLNFQF